MEGIFLNISIKLASLKPGDGHGLFMSPLADVPLSVATLLVCASAETIPSTKRLWKLF